MTAVLLPGRLSELVTAKHGDYGKMIVDTFKRDGETWRVFNVEDGEFPTEEELNDFQTFFIPGSVRDAHCTETPFIVKLKELIRKLYDDRKKLIGICFGHQCIAGALGGVSGRADVGYELGMRRLEGTKAFERLFPGEEPTLSLLEVHQDQVLSLPKDAEVVASSARTPIEVFCVGTQVLGVQSHPEFSNSLVDDLVTEKVDKGVFDASLLPDVKTSLQLDNSNARMVRLIQQFIDA